MQVFGFQTSQKGKFYHAGVDVYINRILSNGMNRQLAVRLTGTVDRGEYKVSMLVVNTMAAIKDFDLPDKVSGALKILPDISKIYRTSKKFGDICLVAFNFFIFYSIWTNIY